MTDELTPDSTGTWVIHCTAGCIVILELGHGAAQRQAGDGAVMPADGEWRTIRWTLAWPKVGYSARWEFADGSRLTTTEVRSIVRYKAKETES